MKVQRRTNLLWGVVFLGAAILVLLGALDVLPAGIADLVKRAWPALLVLVGLSVLLRDRVPFGSFIALVVCAALVAGVTLAGFSNRAGQERDDYQEIISQPVGGHINLLRLRLSVLSSDVELIQALDAGGVSGQFTGSTESAVLVDYFEAPDNTATLTITETRPNQFPLLEAMGRGELQLELPPGLPLDVEVNALDGEGRLNMGGLALERLNLDLQRGDALVSLPEYRPLGSPEDATLGALVVRDGNISVFVPPTVAGRFELNRGNSGIRPEFDPSVYNLLDIGSGVLEARNFDAAEIKHRYVITAPRGLITVSATG